MAQGRSSLQYRAYNGAGYIVDAFPGKPSGTVLNVLGMVTSAGKITRLPRQDEEIVTLKKPFPASLFSRSPKIFFVRMLGRAEKAEAAKGMDRDDAASKAENRIGMASAGQ